MALRESLLYRLRLLAERSRFYTPRDTFCRELAHRGLAVRTGRIDERGRIEWEITDTGRDRLREAQEEP